MSQNKQEQDLQAKSKDKTTANFFTVGGILVGILGFSWQEEMGKFGLLFGIAATILILGIGEVIRYLQVIARKLPNHEK
ncbi:hypothetical protein [Cohnella cholangitidis]|uniref:Uncharacterized protein n=1 Tax=Cohnella cholangitidis TaxID=2598458 RepID=A0A7G5C4Y1_9BACL|nr:hypothetical protein [Cohnella cholangitidis]QMV44265.1 hypothetical protein FPL14_26180 [Cohnella cholangitidis]